MTEVVHSNRSDMALQTVTERYKYREGNILYITLRKVMRKRGEGT